MVTLSNLREKKVRNTSVSISIKINQSNNLNLCLAKYVCTFNKAHFTDHLGIFWIIPALYRPSEHFPKNTDNLQIIQITLISSGHFSDHPDPLQTFKLALLTCWRGFLFLCKGLGHFALIGLKNLTVLKVLMVLKLWGTGGCTKTDEFLEKFQGGAGEGSFSMHKFIL